MPRRPGGSPRRFLAAILYILVTSGHALIPHQGSSQTPPQSGVFDAWARWAVSGPWKGPVTPYPRIDTRPTAAGAPLRSSVAPVAVHQEARVAVSPQRLATVLRLTEQLYAALRLNGYAVPHSDGGRAGTAGFDLYVVDGPEQATAALDSANLIGTYDAALVHGRLSAHIPDGALPGCIAQTLADAGLLALEPAENALTRHSSAILAAYHITGQFGCQHSPASLQQQPQRGIFDDPSGAQAALFLAVLAERQHHDPGRFVQDMWQFARQRSEDLSALQGSPTLWEAIGRALENAGEWPDDVQLDFATARYFAGIPERRQHATYPVLRALPSTAAVPTLAQLSSAALPQHVYESQGLGVLGSAYIEVLIPEPQPGAELRVWLRGDPKARWSLSAVRLAADYRDLGRVSAGAHRTRDSYVPLVLTTNTKRALIVVTRLPRTTLAEPDVDPSAAPFKVIVDWTGKNQAAER